MKVSCIMPTWNQAEFIEEAFDSVVDQVDELIIVNDGSTDGTEDWLEDTDKVVMNDGVFVEHYTRNYGIANAINAGFSQVEFDLVTWVSSDNVHTPNWRAELEKPFGEDDVGAVYSAFWYGKKGRTLYQGPYHPIRLITTHECYFGPSFMIRRDVWEAAGDHRGRNSHDYDHWLRIEESCWDMKLRIVSLVEPLCLYRVHDKRVTVTRKHEYDGPLWQQRGRARRRRRAER